MKKIKFILACLVVISSYAFSATQMDFLMSGVMDNAGKPLSYGSVFFYENNGGTTAKAIYSSSVAISANLLPSSLSLNASGVPTNIPFGSGYYRIVWKDRYGVTVKTVSDVAYGVSGSNNYVIDVRQQYGVNDTAINSAIAAAGAVNTTLLFQGGEFTLGSNKTFPTNLVVQFYNGAYWTVNNGVLVTVSSNIEAPDTSWIFRGLGNVKIDTSNNAVIYSAWKGAGGTVDVKDVIKADVISNSTLNTSVINATAINNLNWSSVESLYYGNSLTDYTLASSTSWDGERWFRNLEINSGVVLSVNRLSSGGLGWLVLRVNGTLTLNTNVTLNGSYAGQLGSAGGTSASGAGNGNPGATVTYNGLGASGGMGGSGGSYGVQTTGAGGKSVYIPGLYDINMVGAKIVSFAPASIGAGISGNTIDVSEYQVFNGFKPYPVLYGMGGTGGGSGATTGGGNTGEPGGAGGVGAGAIIIFAKNIVITGNVDVIALGAAGTKGTDAVSGSDAPGAGGGGGAGGFFSRYYSYLTGEFRTVNLSGGAGGVSGAQGSANLAGTGGKGSDGKYESKQLRN